MGSEEAVTSSADDLRNHLRSLVVANEPVDVRTRLPGIRPRSRGEEAHSARRGIPHEQADKAHQEEGHVVHREEESGSYDHDLDSILHEEESDDDSHHGRGGYTHEEVRRDVRNSPHPEVDILRGEAVSENDRNVQSAGRLPEAIVVVRRSYISIQWLEAAHTSARQRTLEPLNSELSSLSTATFMSAAVSNSTKLRHVS